MAASSVPGTPPSERLEQVDVLREMPGPEEVPADLLTSGNAKAGCPLGLLEEIHDSVREDRRGHAGPTSSPVSPS